MKKFLIIAMLMLGGCTYPVDNDPNSYQPVYHYPRWTIFVHNPAPVYHSTTVIHHVVPVQRNVPVQNSFRSSVNSAPNMNSFKSSPSRSNSFRSGRR